MKEKPILFTAPMILAILNGSKTQTRRRVKNPRADFPGPKKSSPYGAPGDQLWVRETFSPGPPPIYRATDHPTAPLKWTPAIFMPHSLSRISLTILSVSIQDLHSITVKDVQEEGFKTLDGFQSLWRRINGTESWSQNPLVWAITFTRSKP